MKEEIKDVVATYLFPNGIVVCFDKNDKQIGELQGRLTHELLEKIMHRSTSNTENHGFHLNNLRKALATKHNEEMIENLIKFNESFKNNFEE